MDLFHIVVTGPVMMVNRRVKMFKTIVVCVMLFTGIAFAGGNFDMKYINMVKVMAKTDNLDISDSKKSKYYTKLHKWNELNAKEKEAFATMISYYNLYIGNDCTATIYSMDGSKILAVVACDGIKIYHIKPN